jgi:uncharacterized metal-binding protein
MSDNDVKNNVYQCSGAAVGSGLTGVIAPNSFSKGFAAKAEDRLCCAAGANAAAEATREAKATDFIIVSVCNTVVFNRESVRQNASAAHCRG